MVPITISKIETAMMSSSRLNPFTEEFGIWSASWRMEFGMMLLLELRI